jgi:nucleotide-binding universal stress UspA family protein
MKAVPAGAVVVGVDGSDSSDAAVAWAAEYAETRRRHLVLMGAAGRLAAPSLMRDRHDARQARRIEARRATDHALGIVRKVAQRLEVHSTMPLAEAEEALLAATRQASLVVVGTRGRGRASSRLLGSVSAAVCERAECPVAVVREATLSDVLRPGPVVVGTDGTALSSDALDFAFDLAATEGLSLHVVHNVGQDTANMNEHQRALEIAIAGHEERYPDVEVHRHLPLSGPADTLAVLSETASAVVVGARSHHGPVAALGSVSRAVVERARCPVVVVRSGSDALRRGASGKRRSLRASRAPRRRRPDRARGRTAPGTPPRTGTA